MHKMMNILLSRFGTQILLGLLGNEYRDAKHRGEAAFQPISADQVPNPPI